MRLFLIVYCQAISEALEQAINKTRDCHDNLVMENFFGLLKQEIYYGHAVHSFEELKFEIEAFITYYNNSRTKQKLRWKLPVEFRHEHEGK